MLPSEDVIVKHGWFVVLQYEGLRAPIGVTRPFVDKGKLALPVCLGALQRIDGRARARAISPNPEWLGQTATWACCRRVSARHLHFVLAGLAACLAVSPPVNLPKPFKPLNPQKGEKHDGGITQRSWTASLPRRPSCASHARPS